MPVDTEAYYGQTEPTSAIGNYNQLRFVIRQEISALNTSMPVEVISVTPGNLGPVGFVSVRILVDQVTGNDMTSAHVEIPNVPYMRLQGGTNAVIIDPQVGDIGLACFCSRDISAVKNARKTAPPGSRRMYSFSDCAYIGGILNGAPAQYIQFAEGGIIIHSPNSVKSDAPLVQLGNVSGVLRKLVDDRLIALFNSHKHGGGAVPDIPLTPASVLTVATEAN